MLIEKSVVTNTTNLIVTAMIFLLCFNSCKDQPSPQEVSSFEIGTPDLSIALPKQIKNLAGMSCDTSRTLWVINDSDPTLFKVDVLSKKLANQITISNDGDYKGMSYVDGFVYMARNDGFLKRIAVKKNKSVKTFFNPIEEVKNIGGMCYSKKLNQLLLVDGSSTDNGVLKIYSFDLEKLVFNENPSITLSMEKVAKQIEADSALEPTGLAIHPTSGDLYISFNNQEIVIVDKNGTLKNSVQLSQSANGPIGGIEIDKNGSLLVGYQGNESAPMFYRYNKK